MVLVFGKNGQVASALAELKPDWAYISSSQANFLAPLTVLKYLDEHKPTIVINAAAYTQVDKAETERDQALTINARTVEVIAQWCARNNALMVHFSTDYVFDGTGTRPWLESDPPSPVNWYGQTKLEGEKAIQSSGCKYYIFRISWVYSDWGHNFKKTILRLASERKELRIVNDQWGSPTDARDVAKTVVDLVDGRHPSVPPEYGIYHLRYSPFVTWYDFANSIIKCEDEKGHKLMAEKIIPISSAGFPTPARRPSNSRMNSLYGIFISSSD